MIPSNILLTQLLPLNELTVQPTAPTTTISDKLSELIPGQRVLAEIQARLPNGAYRAAIGQRDVTLSLNFSAKPGEKLELEVVENNGHLALAVAGKALPPESTAEGVTTNLSKTGQLISALTTTEDGKPIQPPPAPINKGQALFNTPTLDAALLAPRLQQTIENSGLFYEAHLTRWVFGGDITEQQLRQEPQGEALPSPPHVRPEATANLRAPLPASEKELPAPTANTPQFLAKDSATAANIPSTASSMSAPTTEHVPNTVVPQELAPLVQQQLASLSNQPLQWQGQLTPGQNFHWEIIKEEKQHQGASSEETSTSWQTKLNLSLPELGDIEARLHIQGSQIGLVLEASDASARDKLIAAKDDLRKNLAATGLTLTSIGIAQPAKPLEHLPESQSDAA